ncbi:NAD(P)-binding protein [Sarocladium strictum]
MSSPWIFISPSSRGIGHALTRHLLRTTSLPILASTRSSDPASTKSSLLKDLPQAEDIAPRLSIVQIDVTDESSVAAAADRARELFPSKTHHLRLACAIPGMLFPEKNPKQIDMEKALQTFQVNTLGPLVLMKHFAEMLPKQSVELEPSPKDDQLQLSNSHALWLNMAARVGSTSDNRAGGWYSYRASKAGVISLSKSLDRYLAARNGEKALAMAYHPGTVKTGLSKDFWDSVEDGKLFSPEDAAAKMASVMAGLKVDQRGKCWDWKNEEVLP